MEVKAILSDLKQLMVEWLGLDFCIIKFPVVIVSLYQDYMHQLTTRLYNFLIFVEMLVWVDPTMH